MFDKFDKRNSAAPRNPTAQPAVPAAAPEAQSGQPPPAPRTNPQVEASIGPGLKVSGEVSGKADLKVEGTIEGGIHLPGNRVTVAQSGNVKANITAASVTVSGRVVGDIEGHESVVLTKTSVMRGNIKGPQVSLEAGSKFQGSIDSTPSKEEARQPAAPIPKKPATVKDVPARAAAPQPKESAARH